MNSGALLAFFDSIAPQFPHGISLVRTIENSSMRVVFVHATRESVDPNQQALLDAAITKGLKLALHDATHLSITALKEGNHQAAITAGTIVVLLGRSCAEEAGIEKWTNAAWSVIPGSGRKVLLTHSLKDIVAKEEMKREFWKALKELLQILPLES